MKKLAIVITHPIQYYVPVFRLLAKKCLLKVFYTWGEGGVEKKYDPGFGKEIEWDLPLLDGYDYKLLNNISTEPGSHHGKGIINPDIINEIEKFSPDSILVYGYIYHSHFKVMRHFKGKIPIWFRGDSTLLDEVSPIKKKIKKVYLNWVYKKIDLAFYVGTNNRSYFKTYGLASNQLVFAPHAIDNERFSEDRSSEALELRHDLGIAPSETLILFAGKLEGKKNPEFLLDSFLKLKEEKDFSNSQNIHLLFVGNGILEQKLKSKSMPHNDKIHFMDFQNQLRMPVIYQASDIFCLPSKGPGETWGLAVNEAMASGKTIIVSNKVGCAIDLVQDNGFIFQHNDFQDFIEKLKGLTLKSNIELQDLGKISQEIISQWIIEKQANSFIKVLYGG